MQKILVIKHGALGDIIQAIDAFASLRESFPKAQITILTTAPFAELLTASHWFDEILIDRRKPIWHIKDGLKIKRLFQQNWNAVIDLQCSGRTASYFRLTRAGIRWFGTAKSCSDPMPDFTGINNRERMLMAVKRAGADEHKGTLDWLTKEGLLTPLDTIIPPRYSVFFAGSSQAKPSKRWPHEHYAAIAAHCVRAGIIPLLCGAGDDLETNQQIKALVPQALDLTKQTNLADLACLAKGAVFVIGNDTGPVFLASRMNAPSLMLMGPDTDAKMSAPIGANAKFLQANPIEAISVQTVWKALDLSLDAGKR